MKQSKTYLGKGKTMLFQGLLFVTLFSCSKEGVQDSASQNPSLNPVEEGFQPEIAASAAAASSPNLVYEETFEGSNPLSTYVSRQFATSHAFTVASSPVFAGSKSGRFELRDSDPLNNDGTRAELSFPYQSNLNRWYSFSAYFPSATYKFDASDEVISQWHQGGGYSPALSLRTREDKYQLIIKPTPTTTEKLFLAAIEKDKWNTFVFHIKHSPGSDGVLEIWLNGKKVFNRAGQTMYALTGTTKPPKWKMGIYKSDWNGSQTTDTKIRIFYYDNIRLGNENATYENMASGGSITPPPPPPPPADTTTGGTPTNSSPITSFTLVSAHTEKDIMTIANGATISLSQISVPKLNIRANYTGSQFGSVKFELTGTQIKTVNDATLPYTLNGDAGTNYGFGNWYPPKLGTYTLKATPYSGSRGTGTAGKPYSISFTFVK
jgi:hypothetical protein